MTTKESSAAQGKKPAQTAARLASDIGNKAARTAEHARSQAEQVMTIGSNAVRDLLATSTGGAKEAREKAFAMGRESAEHIAKSADAITKALYEGISMSRDNVETCIECGNMAANMAKDMSSEIFDYANKAFTDNVEISKEFFACRTLNDMFDLQNRIARKAIDNFFNQSVKLSGMAFEYATEALEPINERVAQASEQFSKAMAA